ncbi:uncharacterized protein LOC130992308 isoform X1 [Salvia miltiorrhiza]|uniref:uncharacterized protein LOC130992308 isoform X1 n=1 Tax=Salvia miltiorrhiza TaxID=226208 RepID=UPI0025ACA140|nr:uncharacterized protein LOC130992308 isoform X1 [Salvia miltiorrhiza]
MGTVFERFSLSLSSISMVQIWEVLHPWLHPTLQIHDSRLFLYKWALEIARKGKSCRSFFVLGATTGCDSYCSPQSTEAGSSLMWQRLGKTSNIAVIRKLKHYVIILLSWERKR